nr:MAG TPA: hypothetical protein [Caudoviricetes sp.]
MNKTIRLLAAATLTLTGITATTPNPTTGAGTPADQIIHYTHFGTEQRPGNTDSSTGTRTNLGSHDMIGLLFTNPSHRIAA